MTNIVKGISLLQRLKNTIGSTTTLASADEAELRYTKKMVSDRLKSIKQYEDGLVVDEKNGNSGDQFYSSETRSTDNASIDKSHNDQLQPPQYQQEEITKLRLIRNKVGGFVNSTPIQSLMLALIIVNAIMMGIGTFSFVSDTDLDQDFETTDQVFLYIFTVELALQLFYWGLESIKDPWLVFDFVIVICSHALSQIQVIRAVRIFRALRLVTHLKTMRDLVEALAKTLPRMAGITALLSLIIYIFSVMFTEFFRDMYHNGEIEQPYFARLDGSLLTSFQMMTFDNWAEIAREVMAHKPWAWLPFVAFILMTGFMVVHLVIAVICDAIADLHDDDKEKLQKNIFADLFGTDAIDAESDCNSNVSQEQDDSQAIPTLHDQVTLLEKQVQELVISNERTLHWLKQLTNKVDEVRTLQ